MGPERSGLPVQWHNIWENDQDAAYVRSVSQGNETVPTVNVAGKPLTNPGTRDQLEPSTAHIPDPVRDAPPAEGLEAGTQRREVTERLVDVEDQDREIPVTFVGHDPPTLSGSCRC
ncbi:hypothetical protein [Streptomyces canus]|uniref:hypothetical protein n=1 Tax=Streptomyces canus TaxID=58343 RepID=UPI0037FEA5E1